MNRDECDDTQQRITDPVCDLKTCCYYCGDHIKNIDQAKVIHDYKDKINNLVCSFRCDGIPDEMKDNCAYCRTLFFDNRSEICSSCWCAEREL
jgi:hypothetical protein